MGKGFLVSTVLMLGFGQLGWAEAEPPSVNVSGTCVRSVQPDQVEVSVGVVVRNADAQKAVAAAAPTYEKLLKAVKALNLKNTELVTTQMNVDKVYDYVRNERVDKGYEANYTFSVLSADTARIGEVFKVAKDKGANTVIGPRFCVSKALRKKENESCLAEAVKNARSKAEAMAEALGVGLTGKAVLRENAPMDVYSNVSMMQMKEAAGGAPSVESKKEDIQVSLNATFFVK